MTGKKSFTTAMDKVSAVNRALAKRQGKLLYPEKPPRKVYDHEFRVNALLKLRDYDWDYEAVCKELDINHRTLYNWKQEYGKMVYEGQDLDLRKVALEPEQVIAKQRAKLMVRNTEIMNKALIVQDELIDRIRKLSTSSMNIFHLTRALEVLNNISNRKIEGVDDNPATKATQVNNYNQYVSNQISLLQQDIEWKKKKLAENP